jgi:hypothetical protein
MKNPALNFIELKGCDDAQIGGCPIFIQREHVVAVRGCTKLELENYQQAVDSNPTYYATPKAVVCTPGTAWFVQETVEEVLFRLANTVGWDD